jgi:hypothetical protein
VCKSEEPVLGKAKFYLKVSTLTALPLVASAAGSYRYPSLASRKLPALFATLPLNEFTDVLPLGVAYPAAPLAAMVSPPSFLDTNDC